MQIKKFKAKTMTEALQKIKNEFGSDAVILSARNLKRGNYFLAKHEKLVEVTAATDSQIESSYHNYGHHRYAAIDSGEKNIFIPNTGLEDMDNGVVSLLRSKKNQIQGNKRLPVSITKILFNIYNQLLDQNVDEHHARTMLLGLNKIYENITTIEETDIKNDLVQLVKEMGATTKRIKLKKGKQRIIALLGTSGVGKTTTIAKIAALGQKYLNKSSVGMITIDDSRIGAIEQTKIYAKIMGIEMESVANTDEFKLSIKKLRSKNLVLIDTPAINPFNKKQLQNILAYLTIFRPIEIHLLLGANSKTEDMFDHISKFNCFPVSHLLFTKVDESLTHGNILNQLIATKIPVSYLSSGPRVPEDLESATLEKLLELILKNPDKLSLLSGSPEGLAKKFSEFEKILDQEIVKRSSSLKNIGMMQIRNAY